jgi:leucyl aminopeptidase
VILLDILVTDQTIKDVVCDALVVGAAFQKTEQRVRQIALTEAATVVDNLLGGLIHEMYADEEYHGNLGELIVIHTMGKLAAKRVVVVGLGEQEKLNSQAIRRASAVAARHLQNTGIQQAAMALNWKKNGIAAARGVQAEVEGALLGPYAFKKYQNSNVNGNGRGITTFLLLATNANDTMLDQAIRRGIALAEATNFARDLVNEPPNVLTPGELANRANAMAKHFGLESEVLDRPQMQALGMGGLLAVAQGSAEPPKFIILRYRGTPQDEEKGIALVGKGITFDTGGVSLKTAEQMLHMKSDMAGAAAVIGTMQAITSLKPTINVTALIPAAENMPGGSAYRPGDILRIMNGKTVEIVNTDAEGRLVLADALSYAAAEGLSPIIDVATLTGGIVTALGSVMSGIFCNDTGLSNEIIAAGQAAGEKFWPMPLDEEYAEQIQSEVADIKQSGGRQASPVTAAKILEQFVGDAQWAHLDIAGTDFLDSKKPYQEKGATGVAVRTLAELVLQRAKASGYDTSKEEGN